MALRRNPHSYKSKFQEKKLEVLNALLTEGKAIVSGDSRSTRLYDYQIEALVATNKYFQSCGKSPAKPSLIIVAPTGAGKSGIAVITPYILGSDRVLVLSPSPLISTQLATAFGYDGFEKSFFHQVGLTDTEDDYEDYKVYPFVVRSAEDVKKMRMHHLVIVNAQKFGGNSNTSLFHRNVEVVRDVQATFKHFSTIIVDEAQHYPAKTWLAIVDNFRNKQIIFFTATPFNNGKAILGRNQKITYEVTREQIEGNTTRRCHFRELDPEPPAMAVESLVEMGRDINQILNGHDKLEPVVKHKALVLVYTKREAELVGKHMENATYFTSNSNSEGNFAGFQGETYRIMAVCGKCVEGYDNRDISVCVVLRNVKSRVLFTQFVGRCLRTSFPRDRVSAMVLSHSMYNQRPMWDQHNEIAQLDPEDDD